MTCYFRHLARVFAKAGIIPTDKNKKDLDRKIHELVCIAYKGCPAVWKEVKTRIADDEAFILALKKEWNRRD